MNKSNWFSKYHFSIFFTKTIAILLAKIKYNVDYRLGFSPMLLRQPNSTIANGSFNDYTKSDSNTKSYGKHNRNMT